MHLDGVEPASFRDRNARVFYSGASVYRGLGDQALREWEALSATSFFPKMTERGSIVRTERIAPDAEGLDPARVQEWAAVLKHEPIPFISYPYEWTFGMLKDAALLQLELLQAALDENMILKDSSAYNIQWHGSSPVFIDTASFEALRTGEPWIGYRQFCQLFLYPLMLQAYRNVPFQPLLRGLLDGIDPETFSNMMGRRDLLRSGVFLHGYLQAKAQAAYGGSSTAVKKDLRAAGFNKELIKANIRGLQKLVAGLAWQRSRSEWSNYVKEHSYTDDDYERKKAFVRSVAAERRRSLAWDLGCNTGTFSRIAAEHADCVVAMDADHLAVEFLYHELQKEKNTTILPLVGNIADPSPGLGWKGEERKPLPARGKPELTLCLALIHHVVISANIPLREFLHWLSTVTESLVIEFVTKDDPMVQKLLRNKIDNYTDYEIGYFETCLDQLFSVTKREELKSGTRVLYFAEEKK